MNNQREIIRNTLIAMGYNYNGVMGGVIPSVYFGEYRAFITESPERISITLGKGGPLKALDLNPAGYAGVNNPKYLFQWNIAMWSNCRFVLDTLKLKGVKLKLNHDQLKEMRLFN